MILYMDGSRLQRTIVYSILLFSAIASFGMDNFLISLFYSDLLN